MFLNNYAARNVIKLICTYQMYTSMFSIKNGVTVSLCTVEHTENHKEIKEVPSGGET